MERISTFWRVLCCILETNGQLDQAEKENCESYTDQTGFNRSAKENQRTNSFHDMNLLDYKSLRIILNKLSDENSGFKKFSEKEIYKGWRPWYGCCWVMGDEKIKYAISHQSHADKWTEGTTNLKALIERAQLSFQLVLGTSKYIYFRLMKHETQKQIELLAISGKLNWFAWPIFQYRSRSSLHFGWKQADRSDFSSHHRMK